MADKYVTKPGAHGTLYLHRVAYRDAHDPGCPDFEMRIWAYDFEHAIDLFADGEDGWTALSVSRVLASGLRHRETRHKISL